MSIALIVAAGLCGSFAQGKPTIEIPLTPDKWQKTSLFFQSMPDFKFGGDFLTIESDEAVGGYAYIFPEIHNFSGGKSIARWMWRVETHPTAKPQIPFTKEDDDYALRVGFLIDAGTNLPKLPGAIRERLAERNLHISHIVFYVTASSQKESCALSPYSDKNLVCLRQSKENWQEVTAKPLSDLQDHLGSRPGAKIIGVWLFADSDNSESRSKAALRPLTLGTEPL